MDSNKKETKTRFSIKVEDFIGYDDYRGYLNFRAYTRLVFSVFLCILIIWLSGGKTFKEEVKNYYTPAYKNVKFTSYVDRYNDNGKSTTPMYQINGICNGNYVTLYSTDNDLVDSINSAGELKGRKLKYKIGNTYKINVSPSNQVGVANGVIIFGVLALFISLFTSIIFLVMSALNIWSSDTIQSYSIEAITTKAKASLLLYEGLSLLIPLIFIICSSRWIYFWAVA